MKAVIDKREYDHKTFVRVKLSEDVGSKIVIYLNIKKPVLDDGGYMFEYVDDSLISILSFLEKLFERFNIKYDYQNSILIEIDNFKKEQKSFNEFSEKAFKIRNNDFDGIEDLATMYKDFESVVISTIKRKLYPLQFLSAFHMAYGVNTMNFSVPGSGKTSIVYAAYSYLKSIGLVEKLFVIGPLSSFQAWEKEYFNCFDEDVISYRYSGVDIKKDEKKNHLYSDNPAELNLIYFQGVEGLSKDLLAFMSKHKTMLVVDEAHRIKNADGKWGKNITKISQAANSRVVLTGTPIPNGYEDIYNLTKFIYPFKFKSILNFHYSQLQELSKTPNNQVEVENLKQNLSPFFMRIRKEDLKELPIVNEKEVPIKMGDVQDEIYHFIYTLSINLQMTSSSDLETDFLIRAILIRLRQAATNPFLLSMSLEKSIEEDFFETEIKISDRLNEIDDKVFDFDFRKRVNNYYQDEVSSKVKYCVDRTYEIVSSIDNSKVLIWTIFTENAKYLKRELKKLGIKSEYLIGMVEPAQREVIVNDFNNLESQLKVVIANPFTVGESVSLHHGCNYAIYLERDYNCSNFVQSKDRIHRVGSKFSEVNYEYLISKGTIDEVISKRLQHKVARMSELVDDDIPFFKLLEDDNEEAILLREALKLYKNT